MNLLKITTAGDHVIPSTTDVVLAEIAAGGPTSKIIIPAAAALSFSHRIVIKRSSHVNGDAILVTDANHDGIDDNQIWSLEEAGSCMTVFTPGGAGAKWHIESTYLSVE